MKRIQLFEFEDQSWFPDRFRIALTKLIAVLHKITGLSDIVVNELSQIIKITGEKEIIDLGSGAGGPMPEVFQQLKENGIDIKVTLSDLFPNEKFVREFNAESVEGISYSDKPIDATHLECAPKGLKTFFNSFHHMPPEMAKKIFHSAQASNEPIFIYEMANNKIPLLIWLLLLPISLIILFVMVLFMTPFVKKLTWDQVVFTYLIPIIPIAYAWDGQASLPRIYSHDDVQLLIGERSSTEKYKWIIADAQSEKGKKMGYYIFGYPVNSVDNS